ncbi:MAG: SLC13 family permease [Persicimonas sp.]
METEILIVSAVLGATILLIVTELIRIDVVAIVATLVLTWSGVISPEEARSGFASNAVLAIVAVMIMGQGLARAGVTDKLSRFILHIAGRGKRRILSLVSVTVGVMSGFMQNVGAAALFLPVMMSISKREKIPISTLLMPMGFAALLGGTLTMVGTSSLIILNDLLAGEALEPFGLFDATPIGIALLLSGIAYFFIFGDAVFPEGVEDKKKMTGKHLLDTWGLSDSVYTFRVPADSPIVDKTVEQTEMGSKYNVNLLRTYLESEDEREMWKIQKFAPGKLLVVQGRRDDVMAFAADHELELIEAEGKESDSSDHDYLEILIPARSNLVGQSIRDIGLRDTYNAQVVLFFSDSEVIEEDVVDRKIKAGDTLIVHGQKEHLQFFKESENFIAVTPLEYEKKHPEKALIALSSFTAALAAVFALGLPISIGFLSGAAAMILFGVIGIEDAYRAVEWKVIFLIAGLLPVGLAMENSGTAALIAESLVGVIQHTHPYVILLVVGVLTTGLSLVMSNVAATIVLVPLVLEMAGIGGLSAEVLVLQVGLCAANSFLLPTHHVNALLMTPGGYRVSDYLRAGSFLSLIFIGVSTTILYFFYLS